MNKEIKKELTMPSKPTETRPPLPWYLTERMLFRETGEPCGYGYIVDREKVAARAAAPAERCIQCQAKIGSRHTDQCPQPGYVDETQVAVEPIPAARVEQRETTAEAIVSMFESFARPSKVCKDLSVFDKLLLAVDTWAASQRTERRGTE